MSKYQEVARHLCEDVTEAKCEQVEEECSTKTREHCTSVEEVQKCYPEFQEKVLDQVCVTVQEQECQVQYF